MLCLFDNVGADDLAVEGGVVVTVNVLVVFGVVRENVVVTHKLRELLLIINDPAFQCQRKLLKAMNGDLCRFFQGQTQLLDLVYIPSGLGATYFDYVLVCRSQRNIDSELRVFPKKALCKAAAPDEGDEDGLVPLNTQSSPGDGHGVYDTVSLCGNCHASFDGSEDLGCIIEGIDVFFHKDLPEICFR